MALYLKRKKKLLKKILLGVSLFAVASLAIVLTTSLLRFFYPASDGGLMALPVLMMTLVTLVTYKPLDKLAGQFLRQYLFKQKSYAHMTLMNLAEDLATVLNLQEFSNLVVNTFGELLHLKTAALLIPEKMGDSYEIVAAYGWPLGEPRRVHLSRESMVVQLMSAGGPHVLFKGHFQKTLAWQDANRLARDFDTFRASWVIPLLVKDELVGALGFSMENPEVVFDASDYHFFRAFGRAISKSLRNAQAMTELKKENAELLDMQSERLQNNKRSAIEQLATGIAHEIHNPLTIISGKAQVLLLQKERHGLDERTEDVLKTIVKQTKRAADITRKLLMFSQGSGAPKEPLDLDQVLEDTLALVSYQTSLDGIEISKVVDSGIPKMTANIHEMREVFLNLILNAVQSVGVRGKVSCRIQKKAQDQTLEISVADTGNGIEKENLEKVFNPFFTTREDSVGLGLFITRQIIHRYGGAIRVESLPGQGSLFLVKFPYGPQENSSTEIYGQAVSFFEAGKNPGEKTSFLGTP